MVTERELAENSIINWNLIEPRYTKPDLLLGNGFSLQFSTNFSYSSLFDIFLTNCDEIHNRLFSQFGTTNFELIQKYLTYALKVNGILGLSTTEINTAIEQLKNGLIQTIEQVHPRNQDINFDQLERIAGQMGTFGNIFTTNYDLYLYHIIMKSKDLSVSKKGFVAYQDYFWGNQAPNGFKQFMSYQNYNYKDIYYLHGSLFLFRENLMDIKLLRDSEETELIDIISEQIRNNKFPTFISEGSGNDKLNSIKNNNYLTFCLNVLSKSKSPIIIFGNSLGDFDNHILRAIKNNPKDIIYCIYCGERTIAEINAEKFDFLSKFNDYPNQVEFVNSISLFEL
jgi:hypothetical protein